jgi:hypothetical protein
MRTAAASIGLGVAVILGAPAALAQEVAATAQAEVTTPAPLPKPAPKPVEPARKDGDDDSISDHDKVVGHLGVGYFGFANLPIAVGGPTGSPTRADVAAPVIGARYWLREKIGVDVGLGLGLTSGSQTQVAGNNTNSQDRAGVFGLAFHGGVPIVLGHQKHYKFLVVPELNIGFATSTETNPAGDITRNGFHFDLGGRVGSEIQFGFIGIPQLSLQATVGVAVSHNAWKVRQDTTTQTNSASVGETSFGTTVHADPWALFVNNISAIYYLP